MLVFSSKDRVSKKSEIHNYANYMLLSCVIDPKQAFNVTVTVVHINCEIMVKGVLCFSPQFFILTLEVLYRAMKIEQGYRVKGATINGHSHSVSNVLFACECFYHYLCISDRGHGFEVNRLCINSIKSAILFWKK